MIIIITGASHTGKTLTAQKLLEKYGFPYLSLDHLKMGLIRSNFTSLTPLSDDSALTSLLWPIASEIIKTAIENKQNLIVEGCYIPSDWDKAFNQEYLESIRCICLVMTKTYIEKHFDDIQKYENVIESRLYNDCSKEELVNANTEFASRFLNSQSEIVLIDSEFNIDIV